MAMPARVMEEGMAVEGEVAAVAAVTEAEAMAAAKTAARR